MIISLTPLKLFNLVQLALLSKLLINQKNAINNEERQQQVAIDKMSSSITTSSPASSPSSFLPKSKGNVMIFVGKHTIQMVPSDHSNQRLAESDKNDSFLDSPHQLPKQISQVHSKNRKPAPAVLYLPYITNKQNKIQFFDFDRDYFSKADRLTTAKKAVVEHAQSSTENEWNQLRRANGRRRRVRLRQSKSWPIQSTKNARKMSQTRAMSKIRRRRSYTMMNVCCELVQTSNNRKQSQDLLMFADDV